MISATEGGGNVKLSVEEIPCRDEEEVIVRCHDAQEKWVEAIRAVTAGEITIEISPVLRDLIAVIFCY